ncbi:MAG TPA: ROK family protein [Candidatus Limnocylindrales bacterium]
MAVYGGIELGGTKTVCVVGTGPGAIADRLRIPTAGPHETLERAVAFLAGQDPPVEAVGIAAFGPLDLDPASATFGSVARTPKRGWSGAPVRAIVADAIGVPVAIQMDVGAAAIAEWRWGAASGVGVAVYITVGTGIGAGIVVDGQLLHGLVHPEFGHVPVGRDPADTFAGVCRFHGDCLEGLASGPAVAARTGVPGEQLAADDRVWGLVAAYLGDALAGLILTLAPGRIVLGGGVMDAPRLLAMVRQRIRLGLAGYLDHPALTGDLTDLVVAPALGSDAGPLGAIAAAEAAASAR